MLDLMMGRQKGKEKEYMLVLHLVDELWQLYCEI